MSLKNRNGWLTYSFEFQGKEYSGACNTKNRRIAEQIEAHERDLVVLRSRGMEPPIPEPTTPPPSPLTLKEFLEGRYTAHLRLHYQTKPGTLTTYLAQSRRVLQYPHFEGVALKDVDAALLDDYTQWRHLNGLKSNTINGEIKLLKMAFRQAARWKLREGPPDVKALKAGKGRTWVLAPEMEALYLERAEYPLKQVAILMLDLGLRPEEVVRLKPADRVKGWLQIHCGKTEHARRDLPLTRRANQVIDELEEIRAIAFPDNPYLFPSPMKPKRRAHYSPKRVSALHTALRQRYANLFPEAFVLYSCRHTFGTRYALSGASPYEIKEAMGHATIAQSEVYIHMKASFIETSMKKMEEIAELERLGCTGSGQIPDAGGVTKWQSDDNNGVDRTRDESYSYGAGVKG